MRFMKSGVVAVDGGVRSGSVCEGVWAPFWAVSGVSGGLASCLGPSCSPELILGASGRILEPSCCHSWLPVTAESEMGVSGGILEPSCCHAWVPVTAESGVGEFARESGPNFGPLSEFLEAWRVILDPRVPFERLWGKS